VALDAAARREGSRQSGRGLRFGLYACGWDLVTLPLGLLVLMLTDGPLSALRHSARGLTAPNSAAVAYAQHVHRFERDVAVRAARRAVTLVFVPVVALIVVGFAAGLMWAARR
jgi:Tfp pilus assembly protein PilN